MLELVEDFTRNFHGDLKNLRGDFVEELLREEINRDYYGERAKELFGTLTTPEQDLILRALRLQEPESEATLNKIELIKLLFMEVGNTELELYFGRHFVVFGTPRTMRLDEMILY